MRFDWDPRKDEANREKHGIGFDEAKTLFTSGVDYVEVFDEAHSVDDDRFIAIGPAARGIIVVVWTEQPAETVRIISARPATGREVELFREYMGEGP